MEWIGPRSGHRMGLWAVAGLLSLVLVFAACEPNDVDDPFVPGDPVAPEEPIAPEDPTPDPFDPVEPTPDPAEPAPDGTPEAVADLTEAMGVVEEVDAVLLTIEVLLEGEMESQTLGVHPDAQITVMGEAGTLEDIQVGMEVLLEYDEDTSAVHTITVNGEPVAPDGEAPAPDTEEPAPGNGEAPAPANGGETF